MSNLTGWRTFIVAALGLVFSGATMAGVVVPADDQAAISAGVIAVAMIVMRLVTKGPAAGIK